MLTTTLSVRQLQDRWGVSRQAVQQIFKRNGMTPLRYGGYKHQAFYSAEQIATVEKNYRLRRDPLLWDRQR